MQLYYYASVIIRVIGQKKNKIGFVVFEFIDYNHWTTHTLPFI